MNTHRPASIKEGEWIECGACVIDPNHADYQHGPWPWVSCHETNFGHDEDEECIFLIVCGICHISRIVEGENPEIWNRWVDDHSHFDLDPLTVVARERATYALFEHADCASGLDKLLLHWLTEAAKHRDNAPPRPA